MAIDEEQMEKLGNFLDNAFEHMNEEEREAFIQEIQREQEKLMNMSPEERAQREEQIAQELNQLMQADNPYSEWFEKPVQRREPEPISLPVKSIDPELDNDATPTTKPTEKKVASKPKKPVISVADRSRMQQLIGNTVQAADTILIKTNNLHEIQHVSWNRGKWAQLKADLQLLKAQLPTLLSQDLILAELLAEANRALRDGLASFEKVATASAKQLQTPDTMGLVTIFDGKLNIVDQSRYDEAVLKFKSLIDQLSQLLTQHGLIAKIKRLSDQFVSEKPKVVINKPNSGPITLPVKTSNSSKESAPCKSQPDKAVILKEIDQSVRSLQQSADQSLLTLANKYLRNPSSQIQRNLQWRLSKLLVDLTKLRTAIFSLENCQTDIQKSLVAFSNSKNILNQLISTLRSQKFNAQISSLVTEIDQELIIIGSQKI